MATKSSIDQAEDLRRQVKLREDGDGEMSSLPPRSEYHKVKKTKNRKFRIKFPLIRFLLVLFLIIVVLALTSPIWLEYLSQS
ncbi:hypothetical protein [Alkalihalobacillus sp. BA299]|uniref:hypothetical protein n=1 Tax=Alkalihalobacillus sp. BA299 TaxID=2815938 RepID=UPI001ADC5635|nr:hypothetical protein [Alkalihalobacillus sp. BA299]